MIRDHAAFWTAFGTGCLALNVVSCTSDDNGSGARNAGGAAGFRGSIGSSGGPGLDGAIDSGSDSHSGSAGMDAGSGGTFTASGGTSTSGGSTGSGGKPRSGGTAGTAGTAGTGGTAGTAGTGGTAGAGGSTNRGGTAGTGATSVTGGTGGTGGIGGSPNTAPGYVNLAPPMLAPFPDKGDGVSPVPPTGWNWYNVDGAICRDGSPTGVYVHRGSANKLLIYLEGGGVCSNDNYCRFNPANVNQVLAGDGQTILGSAAGAGPGRQQPGVYTDRSHSGPPAGIFDFSNAQNPFKDWNQVYIPYCTGDLFFGTRRDWILSGSTTKQQFVGYSDMQKFIGRIVPTFKDKVDRVVLSGSSAGGFGAALNYSMVQDAFGRVRVDALDDSGPPFDDQYMPPCLQYRWREEWGFDASLPPDCAECQQADGAGLVHLADFLLKKHPNGTIAMISTIEDEVIRLFYSTGLKNCANYYTADPVAIALLQADPNSFFPTHPYMDGLNDLRTKYVGSKRFATYFMAGEAIITSHQHLFRSRFYDAPTGNVTIAKFVGDFLGGTMTQIGP